MEAILTISQGVFLCVLAYSLYQVFRNWNKHQSRQAHPVNSDPAASDGPALARQKLARINHDKGLVEVSQGVWINPHARHQLSRSECAVCDAERIRG